MCAVVWIKVHLELSSQVEKVRERAENDHVRLNCNCLGARDLDELQGENKCYRSVKYSLSSTRCFVLAQEHY